jgi:hypothetical protein
LVAIVLSPFRSVPWSSQVSFLSQFPSLPSTLCLFTYPAHPSMISGGPMRGASRRMCWWCGEYRLTELQLIMHDHHTYINTHNICT